MRLCFRRPAPRATETLERVSRKAGGGYSWVDIAGITGFGCESSLDHADRAIAILTTLVSRFPENRDLEEDLGSALAAAAAPLKTLGTLTQAAAYFERSIRIREGFLEGEPHNAHVQRNLLVASGNYCALLGIPWSINMGKPAEARIYCEKSGAIARELSSADPQDKTARYDVGGSLGQLGMVEPEVDQVADSLKDLEEALGILDPLVKANPESTRMVGERRWCGSMRATGCSVWGA